MKEIKLESIDVQRMADELGISQQAIKFAFRGPRVNPAERIEDIKTVAKARSAHKRAKLKERRHLLVLKWVELCSTLEELTSIPYEIVNDDGEVNAMFDLKGRELFKRAIIDASSLEAVDKLLTYAHSDRFGLEWWEAFVKMLDLCDASNARQLRLIGYDYGEELQEKLLHRSALFSTGTDACEAIKTEVQDGRDVDGNVEYQNLFIRKASELYRKK